MRLWSLHARHLDRQALVACWRETLLAQSVLARPAGEPGGYARHPQLERFRALADPVAGVGAYLATIADEADARGYRFDRSRILIPPPPRGVDRSPGTSASEAGADAVIDVTTGQLHFEWAHLLAKLERRSPDALERALAAKGPDAASVFRVVPGAVEAWERGAAAG